MASPVTAIAAAKVFTQALSTVWAPTPLGAPLSVAPDASADGSGWLVTVPLSGVANGSLTAWFEHDGALACATKLLGLDAAAEDSAIGPMLARLVAQAMAVLESHPDAAGLIAADPTVQEGVAPRGAQMNAATWADALACRFGVVAQLVSAAGSDPISLPGDARLEAVLDVDLPLVVRFGRTVMPLRAVSDLSPGSVIDMGRSPDEPVELLVGERLIARGEVVIVGGNYGVRITELTSSRRTAELEARS